VRTRTSRIGWEELAQKLGYITYEGSLLKESGGTKNARMALAEIVGDKALRDAVDYNVSGEPGNETARSVLWLLQPSCAMERCHEIFKFSQDQEERSFAINLLQVVGDARALAWVPEYLADPNPGVQIWGIGIVDQLSWSRNVEPEDYLPIVEAALQHPNKRVRERAREIMAYIESNKRDQS
jgi:hypothetical protein